MRKGKPWFILIYGNYNSIKEARTAITNLSLDLQNQKPWIRKLSQLKKNKIK